MTLTFGLMHFLNLDHGSGQVWLQRLQLQRREWRQRGMSGSCVPKQSVVNQINILIFIDHFVNFNSLCDVLSSSRIVE